MSKLQTMNSTTIIALPIFFGTWLFGVNDWIGALIFCFFFVVIFYSVYTLRMTIRNSVRVYFKEGSLLYHFFEKKDSLPQKFISLIVAGMLAAGFSIFIAILSSLHGVFFLLLMVLMAFITLRLIGAKFGNFEEKNINDYVRSDTNIAGFLITIIFVNFILALVFSAKDLFMFMGDVVRFRNFVFHAENISVSQSITNQYSRILINTYLVVDSFKLAVVNEVMSAFGMDLDNKMKNFYIFYILVFVLNLAKLLPFSLAFVLFAQGTHAKVEPTLRPTIEKMENRLGKWWREKGKAMLRRLRRSSRSSPSITTTAARGQKK